MYSKMHALMTRILNPSLQHVSLNVGHKMNEDTPNQDDDGRCANFPSRGCNRYRSVMWEEEQRKFFLSVNDRWSFRDVARLSYIVKS